MSTLINKYIGLFKRALSEDAASSLMAFQANAILSAAKDELEDTAFNTIIELDLFIRGILNHAMRIEQLKYQYMKLDDEHRSVRIAYQGIQAKYDEIWSYPAYPAFPSILQQARAQGMSPLVTMTNTAPKTLAVYVNFLKEVNPDVVIPKLPAVKTTLERTQSVEVALIEKQILTAFKPKDEKQNDEQRLNELKEHVLVAKNLYVNHSNHIFFSLFHRHGDSGRVRASKFCEAFQQISDYQEACTALVNYLESDTNGNTHPHSFRTMLLSSLVNDEVKEYDRVSKTYDETLMRFSCGFPFNIVHKI